MTELRKSSLGNIPDSEALVEMAEQVIFRPSDEQRKTKASFWTKQKDLPILVDSQRITESHITRMTNDTRINKWWKISGFKEWFLDDNEYLTKVEYLFDLSLESLERIIKNEEPKAQSARVNAIKLVAELANKMPNRWSKNNYIDELINKMDEKQLEAYLERKGVRINLTGGNQENAKATEEVSKEV